MNQGDNDGGRVAGSFTFNAQCGEGKSLSFSGYILAGQTIDEVNAHLDIAAKAVQRQREIAEIPMLEAKLKGITDHREFLIRTVEELEAKKASGKSLTSQEKMNLQGCKVNIEKHARDIEQGQETIAKMRTLLAA